MNYVVKPADKGHLKSLPAIERAAAEIYPLEDLPLTLRSEVTSIDVLQDAHRRGLLWVAVDKADVAVGFLLADIVDGHFHIKELDVHPDHQRKGLGTKLLQCAYEAAAERRFQLITLTTFEHLQWNAPFYRRHGFSVMNETHYGEDLSTIMAYEKEIGLENRLAMCRIVSPDHSFQ
jgi:ribosomal protein S18 acetylase RimI-like enzyme